MTTYENDLSETDITSRLRRLEQHILNGRTPTAVTGVGELVDKTEDTDQLVNIPTTNLQDTEEIQQGLLIPDGYEATIESLTLLNDARNAPNGLDVYVYDETNAVEVIRSGSTYHEPTDPPTITGQASGYFAIENATGAEEAASCIVEIDMTEQ